MKYKPISWLLILLLLLNLFGGCADIPEADSIPLPDNTTVAVTETTEAAVSDAATIVDEAYGLDSMESLPGCHTLTGTVTDIITRYSTKYNNITVEMAVDGCEDRPIQCFRLEGDGTEDLRIGDVITVAGQLMNYKGIIEFDAGCILLSVIQAEIPEQEETEPLLNESDDSAEAVAAYIHAYGCLPDFYMAKNMPETSTDGKAALWITLHRAEPSAATVSTITKTSCPMPRADTTPNATLIPSETAPGVPSALCFPMTDWFSIPKITTKPLNCFTENPDYERNNHRLPGICSPFGPA